MHSGGWGGQCSIFRRRGTSPHCRAVIHLTYPSYLPYSPRTSKSTCFDRHLHRSPLSATDKFSNICAFCAFLLLCTLFSTMRCWCQDAGAYLSQIRAGGGCMYHTSAQVRGLDLNCFRRSNLWRVASGPQGSITGPEFWTRPVFSAGGLAVISL